MEPILPLSTLSTATAGVATGAVTCRADGSVATEDSLFAGFRADASGMGAASICSSTKVKKKELLAKRILKSDRSTCS